MSFVHSRSGLVIKKTSSYKKVISDMWTLLWYLDIEPKVMVKVNLRFEALQVW